MKKANDNILDFIHFAATRRLILVSEVSPSKSRNRGKKGKRSPENQNAFETAALKKYGLEGADISLNRILADAAKDHDSDRLKAIVDGFESGHEFNKGTDTKINVHVVLALLHIIREIEGKKSIPTKWGIREFITSVIPDDCFTEDSDWHHVWKETQLNVFLDIGEPTPVEFRRIRRR